MSDIIVDASRPRRSPQISWGRLRGLRFGVFFCACWSALAGLAVYAVGNFAPPGLFDPKWGWWAAVALIGWPWVPLLCSEAFGFIGDLFVKILGCSVLSGIVCLAAVGASGYLPVRAGFWNWAFWATALSLASWPWILFLVSSLLGFVSKSSQLPGTSLLQRWFGLLKCFGLLRTLPKELQLVLGSAPILALVICTWIAVMPTHEPLVDKGFKAANRIPGVSNVMGLLEAKAEESGGADASTPAASAPAETTPPKEVKKVKAWRMK